MSYHKTIIRYISEEAKVRKLECTARLPYISYRYHVNSGIAQLCMVYYDEGKIGRITLDRHCRYLLRRIPRAILLRCDPITIRELGVSVLCFVCLRSSCHVICKTCDAQRIETLASDETSLRNLMLWRHTHDAQRDIASHVLRMLCGLAVQSDM